MSSCTQYKPGNPYQPNHIHSRHSHFNSPILEIHRRSVPSIAGNREATPEIEGFQLCRIPRFLVSSNQVFGKLGTVMTFGHFRAPIEVNTEVWNNGGLVSNWFVNPGKWTPPIQGRIKAAAPHRVMNGPYSWRITTQTYGTIYQ